MSDKVGRRGFLGARWRDSGSSANGSNLPKRRRPPGAVPEAQFLQRCSACDRCVEACPHHSIFKLTSSVELGAGTPVMVPEQRACHLCEGFPCVQACPDSALLMSLTPNVNLGVARVDPDHCFVFRGPECGACANLCPNGIMALSLVRGRPAIDESLCVGCGLCITACPARPKGIKMLPLEES